MPNPPALLITQKPYRLKELSLDLKIKINPSIPPNSEIRNLEYSDSFYTCHSEEPTNNDKSSAITATPTNPTEETKISQQEETITPPAKSDSTQKDLSSSFQDLQDTKPPSSPKPSSKKPNNSTGMQNNFSSSEKTSLELANLHIPQIKKRSCSIFREAFPSVFFSSRDLFPCPSTYIFFTPKSPSSLSPSQAESLILAPSDITLFKLLLCQKTKLLRKREFSKALNPERSEEAFVKETERESEILKSLAKALAYTEEDLMFLEKVQLVSVRFLTFAGFTEILIALNKEFFLSKTEARKSILEILEKKDPENKAPCIQMTLLNIEHVLASSFGIYDRALSILLRKHFVSRIERSMFKALVPKYRLLKEANLNLFVAKAAENPGSCLSSPEKVLELDREHLEGVKTALNQAELEKNLLTFRPRLPEKKGSTRVLRKLEEKELLVFVHTRYCLRQIGRLISLCRKRERAKRNVIAVNDDIVFEMVSDFVRGLRGEDVALAEEINVQLADMQTALRGSFPGANVTGDIWANSEESSESLESDETSEEIDENGGKSSAGMEDQVGEDEKETGMGGIGGERKKKRFEMTKEERMWGNLIKEVGEKEVVNVLCKFFDRYVE